jgi:hypothetical protein
MVPVGDTLTSSVASEFPVEKSFPVCERETKENR